MSGAAGVVAGGHGGSISTKELLFILGMLGITVTIALVVGVRG